MGKIKTDLLGHDPFGATPLEIDDLDGLLPKFITTRRELFDAEFRNITEAYTKYLTSPRSFEVALKNLYQVHTEMFNRIWKWAGKKRLTNKNIGVDKSQIDVELKKLVDDFKYWEKNKMDPLEISARLHYRLVAIHPFNNGNGRWSRFVTNLYLLEKISAIIQWPDDQMFVVTEFRKKYIESLVQASKHNFEPLVSLQKKYLKQKE